MQKYPNSVRRNARYRGHRESEKFLHDHQEQLYDIRVLYQDLRTTKEEKDAYVKSWFLEEENPQFFNIKRENKDQILPMEEQEEETKENEARALSSPMLQWSGNKSERTAGINLVKRHMRDIDERLAEAERRYRNIENAYK